MKKTVINLFVLTFVLSFAFAEGGFVQTGFAPAVIGSDTLWGGTVSTGARGISAGSDLDMDGKKEISKLIFTKPNPAKGDALTLRRPDGREELSKAPILEITPASPLKEKKK